MKTYKPLLAIAGFVILAFMAWYFWNIVIYILVSAVLSIIGQPLLRQFQKIKIRKWHFSRSLSALLTLIMMLCVLTGFVWFFVPLIARQAEMISEIDVASVTEHFGGTIHSVESFLADIDVIQQDQTLEGSIKAQLEEFVNVATFSHIFTGVISATGSFFMGAFSILFITFFFLRDENMLRNFMVLIFPEKYSEQIKHVMHETKRLLTRYFIGLLGELLTMMTLITIGLTIIGVKNALIIGFLGGLMNIIPYLGPIIGASIGVLFGATSALSLGLYDQIGWISLGIVLVFLIANLIDNMLLQPLIYSTSVKAHPIEIFLVIIMAGSLAGIGGMILAIPTYTVLRILAREFLSQFRLVKKLTEKM